MRRSAIRSHLRSDAQRSWSRRLGLVGLTGLVAVSLGGCVSRVSHLEVANRNKELRERLAQVERSNESLTQERLDLVAEVDDLTVERKSLAAEVAQLRRERDDFEVELVNHRDELAARTYEVESLRSTYDGLIGDLESEVSAGQIEIQRLRSGIEVNVSDRFLFDKGGAALNASGRQVLEKLAEQFAGSSGRIEVIGHTDDTPIRGGLARRFPTNWELGAARAAAVVRFFENAGVPNARLALVSRGSGEPLVPNDTDENRARNRRIEIRVIPDTESEAAEAAETAGPAPAAASVSPEPGR